MKERQPNRLRKIVAAGLAAGALGTAVGGGAAAEATGPVKTITCTTTDRWYGAQEGIHQGDRLVINASGVVIPADVSVDGVQQYDNDPDTATVVGLKSRNNADLSWRVDVDYGGSMLVLPCKTGSNHFYQAVGREASRLDARIGANDAEVRVNYNFIKK